MMYIEYILVVMMRGHAFLRDFGRRGNEKNIH